MYFSESEEFVIKTGTATPVAPTVRVPENSGSGRRIVYAIEAQRVWLIEENESVRLKLKKNKTMLIIIGISLILLIGILYILYRQSQLNADKKLLTLEQSMLRSQMNPHFLFNSLTAIQGFLYQENPMIASKYLSKFSNLASRRTDYQKL